MFPAAGRVPSLRTSRPHCIASAPIEFSLALAFPEEASPPLPPLRACRPQRASLLRFRTKLEPSKATSKQAPGQRAQIDCKQTNLMIVIFNFKLTCKRDFQTRHIESARASERAIELRKLESEYPSETAVGQTSYGRRRRGDYSKCIRHLARFSLPPLHFSS